jgi:hypothetical protein
MTDKLNIVLVHGAFGDGSHWRHIIPALPSSVADASASALVTFAGPPAGG